MTNLKKVDVPIYNFVTHKRESKTVSMYSAKMIIFEGILTFHEESISNMLDMLNKSVSYYHLFYRHHHDNITNTIMPGDPLNM